MTLSRVRDLRETAGGWPDMPDEEIPSLSKYLKEHTPTDIFNRFKKGVGSLLGYGCYFEIIVYRYGYCSQIGLSLIILACGVAVLSISLKFSEVLERAHLVWYIVLFHVIYALSFAWYTPISGHSPRTILSLMIPVLWTLGLIVHSPQFASLRVRVFNRNISVFSIVYTLMLCSVLYEIGQVVGYRAAQVYGGA